MGKVNFLWDNLIKRSATILSASSEADDFPVENLAHNWWKRATRTTGVAAEWWKADLGASPGAVRYFALWYHNFQNLSGFDVRLQANNADAWGAPAVDVPLALTDFKLLHKFTAPQTYRWWRIYLDNPGNTDGYLRAGVWYLGSFFEPHYNFRYRSIGISDPSELVYSGGGQLSSNSIDSYKEIGLEFQAVNEADHESMLDIFDNIGKRTPYFLILDGDDYFDTSYYVLNTNDWDFPSDIYRHFTFNLETEEAR